MNTQKNEENNIEKPLPCIFPNGRLIGLAGFAQSGKDTVGNYLVEKHGFKRLAFADAVRDAVYAMNPLVVVEVDVFPRGFWEVVFKQFLRTKTTIKRVQTIVDEIGWDRAKTEYTEIRELLQKMGTEVGRTLFGENVWSDIIRKKIEEDIYQNFVVTDLRFPNELLMIEELGGNSVKIKRHGVSSVNGHISDKELENVEYVIHNNGTLGELYVNVDNFLKNSDNYIDKPEESLL